MESLSVSVTSTALAGESWRTHGKWRTQVSASQCDPKVIHYHASPLSSLYPVLCGPWAHQTVHSGLGPHSCERRAEEGT